MNARSAGDNSAALPAGTLAAAGFEQARLSLPELLQLRVEQTPDATGLISVRRQLSFAEWQRGAARFAARLREELGELRGERILLWLSNDEAHNFVCALHGILFEAAIAVPLDDRYTAAEALSIVAETQPRAVVVGPLVMENLGAAGLAELGVGIGPGNPETLAIVPVREGKLNATALGWSLEDGGEEGGFAGAKPDDHAVIFFSSGSTGKPKGALWRQGDWAQYAERAAHAIYALPRDGKPLGTDDVLQSPIPLYTAAALMENIYSPVFSGCQLACEGSRFDPGRSLQRIAELGTTIYNGAPPHFAMICDLPDESQAARLELMITGGSAFTRPLFEKIRKRWPQVAIANWFGLMESGSGQTLNWGEDMEREPDTLGRPIWPTEARVVDADLNDVEVGVEGELWLRAPGQIEGYFQNPEQTAKRLHEGWLRTGDRVVQTADGRFRGRGRGEERINRGGFKFYPVEIETVLEAHPDVREAAAVGVSHPVLGENVAAFVVHADGGRVGEEELRMHCRQSLAPNKIPARIHFEQSLPRNAYGKVVRRELRELIAERERSAVD